MAQPVLQCIGCGKVGILFCRECKTLNDVTRVRVRKLWSTIEGKFAMLNDPTGKGLSPVPVFRERPSGIPGGRWFELLRRMFR